MRRFVCIMFSFIFMCGCATVPPPVIKSPVVDTSRQDGYQKPIVEYILIPATIRNGIYIPEHYEYVTVKPGGYTVLDTNEPKKTVSQTPENVELQPKAQIISPSHGEDLTIVVYKMSMDFQDALILKNKEQKYLFKEPIAYYKLYEKEPVRIGQGVYAFSVADQSFNIYTVKNGKVITKSLHSDESYLTSDGYILSYSNKGGK